MPDKDVILSARWTGPADGCLSDGTINKNLDNYKGNLLGDYGLLKRVYDSTEAPIIAPATTRTEKRGYLLSDPARKTQTQTFQTKLSSNINTYIKSKYCSAVLGDPGVDSTWNDHALTDSAFMKNPNATCSIEPNRNGYYYYQG